MAPGRFKKKSWVRGEASISAQSTIYGHNRVWTRPQAPAGGGAEPPAVQPVTPPRSVASASAQQQALGIRTAQRSQAVLASAHPGNGSAVDTQLRQDLQAQHKSLNTVPVSDSVASGSFSRQYVRKRPNQLTLDASQHCAAEPGAAARLRQSAATSGVQQASTLQKRPVVVPRFAGTANPRDVLQQQMAERAAALAGRSPKHRQGNCSASAAGATASGSRQLVGTGGQQPAMPVGRNARSKAASKQWVRPELVASACTAGACRSAAAGTANSPSAAESFFKQRSTPGVAAAAPARTPGRAYRPSSPAWAMQGRRPRVGSKGSFGTPGRYRQNASLRAKRKASTWLRQVGQSGSGEPGMQASAAAALLKHLRQQAHTWHREAAFPSAPAATAAASQTMPAQPAQQTAEHVPYRLGRQPARSRRSQTPHAPAQRPAKLQRIDGQMYRVGGGKGRSRTLQCQPHTPAPAVSTPAQLVAQVSAGKAHRYSVRGKFRRALVRRLSGMPGSPSSPHGSAAARRKLRMQLGSTPLAARSAGIRKRTAVSRLSRKPRTKSAKLPPQIYCTEFCRTGKCKNRQRCKFVHDPSKVAVCPKWLQGRCEAVACPLQHQQQPDLMPVCTFFLQGACSKTNCPYLHVKLEPGARVCEAFLRGWCPEGVACRQKHLTPEMVQQLRRQRILRPGAQAMGRAKQIKRKRYFDAESTADPAAAAGLMGAAATAFTVEAASSSEDDEDVSWESASDSEYEEGLAWGDFMEV